MPKNELLGGFHVALELLIDKNSFDTGNKLIDNVGNSFNKLIGSAKNAANVMANTAFETAKTEDAAYKLSEAWNVSIDALNLWRATAKLTTGDTNALDNALGKLADVKNSLKFGDSGLSSFQKQLDKIKLSYKELKDLNPDEQLKVIFNQAQSLINPDQSNTAEIASYVQKILGDGASKSFIKMVTSGLSIDEWLSKASATIFNTAQGNEDATKFQDEVNEFNQEIDSLKKLLGDDIAKNLTPALSGLNDWIQAHGEDLSQAMDALAQQVAKLLVGAGEDIKTAATVGNAAKDTYDFFTAETPEEKAAALESMQKTVDTWIENKDNGGLDTLVGNVAVATDKATDKLFGWVDTLKRNYEIEAQKKNDLYDVDQQLESYYKAKNKDKKKKDYEKLIAGVDIPDFIVEDARALGSKKVDKYVQDGIIRPDGSVTQVAPDDWVFAARNIGDMARAFIPHNQTAVSTGEYVINQTFNINGGNDMPQVLRQQAYKGTQEGLLQLMQESSRRLQLMPGTR